MPKYLRCLLLFVCLTKDLQESSESARGATTRTGSLEMVGEIERAQEID